MRRWQTSASHLLSEYKKKWNENNEWRLNVALALTDQTTALMSASVADWPKGIACVQYTRVHRTSSQKLSR